MIKLILSLILTLVLAACGKNLTSTDDDTDSVAAIAAGNISGIANSTESSGTLAAYLPARSAFSWKSLQSFLLPEADAIADGGACGWAYTASCDSTGKIVLTFNDCRRGLSTWNGGETLQFDTQATCDARTLHEVLTSGSLVRTFNGTLDSAPTTRTIGLVKIAFDTTTASGYDQSVSGGVSVAFGQDGDGNAQRTITINGIHEVATGTVAGVTRWDHTISTDPSNPVVIVKGGAQKVITSGKVLLQHNLAKFTGAMTVKEPLTFSAGCCHPTGGSVEVDFITGKTGSETLSFQSTCGNARLTAEDGTESSIQLRLCL